MWGCKAAVCGVAFPSEGACVSEVSPVRRRPRRSARASRLATEDSDWDSEMDDDELDEEEGGGGRGGGRGGGASGKEKKKVGRPIAYKGDPDAPGLNEEDRRRIKRCASPLVLRAASSFHWQQGSTMVGSCDRAALTVQWGA